MAYASKYYDPVKAHEYYMRTRELKGYENRYGGPKEDTTTSVGRKSYFHNQNIQQQINSIRTTGSNSVGTINSKVKKDIESLNKRTEEQIKNYQNNIRDLQAEYKSMSRADKKNNRHFLDAIKDIRQAIKDLRKERQAEIKRIREQQKVDLESSRLSTADQIQLLRQQMKGGSTSGFNQKGLEAANYIKKQMMEERDEITKKANKEADDKMLARATALRDRIAEMRKNGEKVDSGEFLAKINTMAKETRRLKAKALQERKKEYEQKYKNEIDTLRSDNSMFTYWDNRSK